MVTTQDLLFTKLHKTSKAPALFLDLVLVHSLSKNHRAHSPSTLVKLRGNQKNCKSKFTVEYTYQASAYSIPCKAHIRGHFKQIGIFWKYLSTLGKISKPQCRQMIFSAPLHLYLGLGKTSLWVGILQWTPAIFPFFLTVLVVSSCWNIYKCKTIQIRRIRICYKNET